MTVSFLLMATACNNDVFIEDPELSEDVEATIEGDGGEATFRIQTKGLERVSIRTVRRFRKTVRYRSWHA